MLRKELIMAQFFYYYGAMNSGKSMDILRIAHNYHEEGKHVLVMTSATDTREKTGEVKSRMGPSCKAYPIRNDTNVYDVIKKFKEKVPKVSCVMIDEAQFLKRHHVLELAKVVDDLNIPVMAFGLKNDFQNHLFEGSENLLIYADKIREIKTVCWFCGKKATMNLRFHNGKPVYNGKQIEVGGNETYKPVCRYHFYHPNLKLLKRTTIKDN